MTTHSRIRTVPCTPCLPLTRLTRVTTGDTHGLRWSRCGRVGEPVGRPRVPASDGDDPAGADRRQPPAPSRRHQLLCDALLKPIAQRGLDARHGADEDDSRVEIVLADHHRAALTCCGLGAALSPAAADLAGAVPPWTPDRGVHQGDAVSAAEPSQALGNEGRAVVGLEDQGGRRARQ